MSDFDAQEEWSLALHEASHAVASWVLGIQPTLAALHPSGGFVLHSQGDDMFVEAVIAAAGPEGQDAIKHVPAPETRPKAYQPVENESERPYLVAVAMSGGLSDFAAAKSDHDTVADYATATLDHTEWTPRANRVHHEAWKIVCGNAAAVVRVATALFHETVLSSARLAELLPQPAPATVVPARRKRRNRSN
jgi:hypothetical protein